MTSPDYSARRDFSRTPEPPPGPAGPAGNRYTLQFHQARRDHYDLRLEWQGALKSWAIPKGLSEVPGERRLAVHTEDHPLAYLEFEGQIPAGEYGAGRMEVWDHGTFRVLGEPDFGAQYARGDLKIFLEGTRLRGPYVLVRTQDDQWLAIRKRLKPAYVPGAEPAEQPDWVEPMLARTGDPFSSPDWAFEIKWDGVRALAFSPPLRVLSRRRNSLLRQFPELESLPALVRGSSFILDGELVALDEAGKPGFERLLPRLQASRPSLTPPVVYYAFDLLFLDGYDLRAARWDDRRALLGEVLAPGPHVRLSDYLVGEGEQLFALVQEQGLEGIMAKRRASAYPGGRSGDWLKIKVTQSLEAVVIGYTEPSGSREHFGSLVLAQRREGQLVYIGHVGSGFTQQELAELAGRLEPGECPLEAVPVTPDPVRWVLPRLTCKVRFSDWTNTGLLRAPVFEGVKEEAPVLRLTNREKVWFPADGIRKGDVLDYYSAVAPLLLPHLAGRPLSLRRYPDGIDRPHFFQKRAGIDFPAWVPTVSLANSEGEFRETPICQSLEGLLFLVNLGCIDHNPWLSRLGSLDTPDMLLLDLDPVDCSFEMIIEGARALHALLVEIGLESFPKTSGSRGIHVYVPLAPRYDFEQTRMLAHVMVNVLAGRHPHLFGVGRARCQGKINLDAPQNRRGATTASAYSVRPVTGAPVSTPLEWDEIRPGLDFRDFRLGSVGERFAHRGDLLAPLLTMRQEIEEPVARLAEILG